MKRSDRSPPPKFVFLGDSKTGFPLSRPAELQMSARSVEPAQRLILGVAVLVHSGVFGPVHTGIEFDF